MIKAVIFDLDNTIYDYDDCNRIAMERLCLFVENRYGITNVEFYSKYNIAKNIVKGQLRNTGASHNRLLYIQCFLELINEKPVRDAIILYDVYWDNMLEHMKPFPYVFPLMNHLRNNGVIIGILTDLTAHIQHRKIKRLGLDTYIDVLVTSEEAGEEKPSKVIFDKIKQKLSCCPEEILMIGDSLKKDIYGARAAGLHGLIFEKNRLPDMNEVCRYYIEKVRLGGVSSDILQ